MSAKLRAALATVLVMETIEGAHHAARAALASEPPATGLDEALFAVGGLTFRLDAMRGAAKAVLAYGAEPPEYPGLVLVPKADLDLLRKVTEAPK